MDFLSVLLQQRTRSIGIIIPDVVITEKHTDAPKLRNIRLNSPRMLVPVVRVLVTYQNTHSGALLRL